MDVVLESAEIKSLDKNHLYLLIDRNSMQNKLKVKGEGKQVIVGETNKRNWFLFIYLFLDRRD